MKTVFVDGQVRQISDQEFSDMGLASTDTIIGDMSWKTISPSQARRALLMAGYLDQVDVLVTQASREVQIWYEFANQWERDHLYVNTFGTTLGLSETQIDNLFKLARTL